MVDGLTRSRAAASFGVRSVSTVAVVSRPPRWGISRYLRGRSVEAGLAGLRDEIGDGLGSHVEAVGRESLGKATRTLGLSVRDRRPVTCQPQGCPQLLDRDVA